MKGRDPFRIRNGRAAAAEKSPATARWPALFRRACN